ncbi:MAG: preprotein translocase subunit TatD [Nevskia sp.]|nr:preprotein translocase subunit TatD [Nevskia sp.]
MLARAWDAGLAAIVVTGSDGVSNEAAAALALRHPARLYATAGLHPHHASDWTAALGQRIAELAKTPQVVAIGECGLDYFRDLSPRPAQQAAFIAQLQLAITAGKPLFLHQRDAHADFLAILREHRSALADCVVHCFTDTAAALDDYLALDCYIGITGWICDERRGAQLLDAVRRIPAQRLLLETDAPYLLPRSLKPAPKHRRNEPAFLPWVLRSVAQARGDDEAELAMQTGANARHFFRIDVQTGRAKL